MAGCTGSFGSVSVTKHDKEGEGDGTQQLHRAASQGSGGKDILDMMVEVLAKFVLQNSRDVATWMGACFATWV